MDYQNDEAQQNDYKAKRGSNKIAPADGKSTPVEFGDTEKALEVEKAAEAKAAEATNGERDAWGGKLDFFLSALSFSVGLGAVWRFPYLCYKNGGGAFLIPFIIFLFILGVPLMYMELAIGQFASRGPIKAWVMSSVARGIGISTTIINNYLSLYYIMIIGYSFYYLVLSLTDVLPWETCGHWAGLNCVDNFTEGAFKYTTCEDKDDEYKYLKCVDDGQCYLNTSTILDPVDCNTNKSYLQQEGWWNPAYPSQDYWNKVVLNKSSNIDDFSGGLVWQLVVALFFAWFVTFFCVFRGVKVSGKIVYFTALFPYLVLMILGINGWMLEGASEGISYYILPKPEKLADVNVWKDAAVQVFFSLSLSYGGLIALSSYNPHNNNCLRDAFFLTISNFLTCIFAGFVVFAYMGALAHETHLPVEKVVQGGQGLVYIVYPFAVTTLPVSPLWSVMFFVMMLALGMGTIMAAVQTLMTSLEDFFPIVTKTAWHKAATLGAICATFFVVGLLFTSVAGSYWIEFFDTYSANWGIFIVALFQCVCVAWVYGIKRFRYDIRSMIPETSPRLRRISDIAFYLWIASWQFIIPVMLVTLTIFAWIGTKPLELDGVVFPQWSVVFGNLITTSTLLGVFGWLGYEMFKVVRGEKTLKEVLQPLPTWRPSSDANYEKWRDGSVYASLSEHPYPRKDEESAL